MYSTYEENSWGHSAFAVARSLLLLLATCLLIALSASAQPEQVPKRPIFKTSDDGEFVSVIVIAEGAKIRKGPSRSAPFLGTAGFLDSYYLIDSQREAGKIFHLVGRGVGSETPEEVLGWLHERDVLTSREAIQEETGIFLKGLIVNQWRQLGDDVKIEGAELHNGPGGKGFEKVGEIGLFSFYFIFKKYEAPDGSRSLLLGESPIVQNVTQPGGTLVGWVDARRVVEWPTRQAVQFDKSTLSKRVGPGEDEGAKLFASSYEVVSYLQGEFAAEGESLQPVAVEDARVTHWQHNWPRFPLLETKENREVPNAGPLFRVGFIGDQIYVSGKTGASREEVAENQERVEKLRSDLKGIDLLFVIDSTGSMRRYFGTAADAVVKIADQVKKEFPIGVDGGPDIRFSVVFYRDYVDEDGEPSPADTYLTKRLPFTGNQAAVARFLEDEEEMLCDGCGGDEPEAVFYGLEYAINTAAKEVSDNVGLRAVVLMGDKGNHARDPRGLDVDDVAQAIQDQRYDFFCFHVAETTWLDRDTATRAFRDQCTEIGRRVEITSQTRQLTTRDPGAIAQAIVDAARSVGKDLEKTIEAARKVSRGEAGLVDIRRQYGVRLTSRLSEMMAERGIDPSIFVEKSVQIFEEGWISETEPLSGKQQVETVLLVDRATLEVLQGLLAGLTKEPPSRQNVEKLWSKVLKDVTQGEADIEKPVAELIENHLGIPVRKKLLSKTLREIASLDPTELNRLYSELQLDLYRIRGLQAEKELDIRRVDTGDGGFRVEAQEMGTRPVWWQGKGSKEYGWIPLKELP